MRSKKGARPNESFITIIHYLAPPSGASNHHYYIKQVLLMLIEAFYN